MKKAGQEKPVRLAFFAPCGFLCGFLTLHHFALLLEIKQKVHRKSKNR